MHVNPTPHSSVRVRYYPQDAVVSEPLEEAVDRASIGSRLENRRLRVFARPFAKAQPDRQGNYIYEPSSPQFDQVHAFVVAHQTLEMAQAYAGRELPFAFSQSQLTVVPHAGEGINAFYMRDRGAVVFFHFKDREGQNIRLSRGADTVSHEVGHAILDGLKPAFYQSADKETNAFHEAFSDCMSLLYAVSRPQVRAWALEETAGNLRLDNAVSRMGEEAGTSIRRLNDDPNDDRPYFRNLNQRFAYVPPDQLPEQGAPDELTSQPHSFGRILSTTVYRGLVNVYEQLRREGENPDLALKQSGEIMGRALLRAVPMLSGATTSFSRVGSALLAADQQLHQGRFSAAIEGAFSESGLNLNSPPGVMDPQGLGFQRTGGHRYQDGYEVVEYLKRTELDLGSLGPYQEVKTEVLAGATLTMGPDGKVVFVDCDGDGLEGRLAAVPEQVREGMSEGWLAPDSSALIDEKGCSYRMRLIENSATTAELEWLAVSKD